MTDIENSNQEYEENPIELSKMTEGSIKSIKQTDYSNKLSSKLRFIYLSNGLLTSSEQKVIVS